MKKTAMQSISVDSMSLEYVIRAYFRSTNTTNTLTPDPLAFIKYTIEPLEFLNNKLAPAWE